MVVHSSCSFIFIFYSIPYVDVPPFSIYSTFDGHSQCCTLVLLWITLIGTFLCMTLLNIFMNCCGTIPRSAWQGRSKDMSRFSICRYYQFPNLHFQMQCVCSPPPPTTLLPHSCWREVVVRWDLICISQMRLKNFHMLNDHLVECLWKSLSLDCFHVFPPSFWVQLLLRVVPETVCLQRTDPGLLEFAYSVCWLFFCNVFGRF